MQINVEKKFSLARLIGKYIFQFCVAATLVSLLALALFSCPITSSIFHLPDRLDVSRFQLNRTSLAKDAAEETITPEQIGSFRLQPTSGYYSDPDAQRHLNAVYQNNSGSTIRLTAILLSDEQRQHAFLSTGTACGECGVGSPQLYSNQNISYSYTFCGCWNYAQHNLSWTNGDWVLSAGTSSHSDLLLQFINEYPY